MTENILRHDTRCRACGSGNIQTVLRLEPTPLEDQFVKDIHLDLPQPLYPLDVALCKECGYVHLPYIVNPEASYADYVYVSGVTVGLRGHYDDYANDIVRDFSIPTRSLAVDLGSNDGSMLESFRRTGMRVLGVEPAQAIAEQANKYGLNTINDFFTDEVVDKILKEYGPASIITANYMFANIDDILSFTKAVSRLLTPDGIFVVQTGYHPEQMKILMFDYIYHEHFSYFTASVLSNLFKAGGLEVVQAKKTSPKGGSIRVVGQMRNGVRRSNSSLERIIDEESAAGMRDVAVYQRFGQDIQLAKSQLVERLSSIKATGKRIVGFGASHSTTTLTYHFGLASYLEYLVDDNPLKHDRYSPGQHIRVLSSEKLYENQPDYVLILAWQHAKSIVERHKAYLQSGGCFIVPLPALQVIGAG
jgi:hypothetical protein